MIYNLKFIIYNFYKLQADQKGSAIFLVILILAGILTATIGINNLVVKGIKFSRNISWSAPAYFAAETGMEKALYQIRKVNSTVVPIAEDINGNFDLNGQSATWVIGFKCNTLNPPNCAGDEISALPDDTTLTIKSTGSYKDVHRSIALSFCIVGDCK
ncbi:hypothetical protein HY750_02630 [Candidatus Kuenenbacteria bacterium]|nr:hypothetical protein [Candidatus Kuenenbacteria bacterium]